MQQLKRSQILQEPTKIKEDEPKVVVRIGERRRSVGHNSYFSGSRGLNHRALMPADMAMLIFLLSSSIRSVEDPVIFAPHRFWNSAAADSRYFCFPSCIPTLPQVPSQHRITICFACSAPSTELSCGRTTLPSELSETKQYCVHLPLLE